MIKDPPVSEGRADPARPTSQLGFYYAPRAGAHVAFDQGFAIVLDLASNRYWALDEAALTKADASKAVDALLRRGVLERRDEPCRSHMRLCPATKADLRYEAPTQAPSLRSEDCVSFLLACAWARRIARRGALVDARDWFIKERRHPRPERAPLGEMRAQFEKLRPLWPLDQVCLFDSLALARFLMHAGHHPEIVFGVRAGPFSAHCWVEHGEDVISDLTGQFSSYAPICRL